MDRITELERDIKITEDYMYMKSMGNDFYYTKGSYTEDKKYLAELKKELQMLLDNENVIPFYSKK